MNRCSFSCQLYLDRYSIFGTVCQRQSQFLNQLGTATWNMHLFRNMFVSRHDSVLMHSFLRFSTLCQDLDGQSLLKRNLGFINEVPQTWSCRFVHKWWYLQNGWFSCSGRWSPCEVQWRFEGFAVGFRLDLWRSFVCGPMLTKPKMARWTGAQRLVWPFIWFSLGVQGTHNHLIGRGLQGHGWEPWWIDYRHKMGGGLIRVMVEFWG